MLLMRRKARFVYHQTGLGRIPRDLWERAGAYNVECIGNLNSRAVLMSSSTSSTSRGLGRLGRSSFDFHDRLMDALYGDEYFVGCLQDIEADDLAWLVDYLDEVRYCLALSPSLLKLA